LLSTYQRLPMLDPIYDDLPDDEELIFLKLESDYRDRCERNVHQTLQNQENGYFPAEDYLQYMRQTSAAAAELQLGIFQEFKIPKAENLSLSDYQDFRGQVDHYRTTLQIRHARRAKGYSVRFDQKTRAIVNHHLTQVRDILVKLEIDSWKKESLLSCLNNLQAEVDKERSSYAVFGAFIIETAGILGDAGTKLKPVRKLVDSVAGLIWGTKHAEQTKQIGSEERRRLPAPKTEPPPRQQSRRGDMDDEIPF
jgi:hypothetical protein